MSARILTHDEVVATPDVGESWHAEFVSGFCGVMRPDGSGVTLVDGDACDQDVDVRNAALMAAAPDLRATALDAIDRATAAEARERALLEMLEGRTVPPTDDEITAHFDAGRIRWLIRYRNEHDNAFSAVVRLVVMNGGPLWSTLGAPVPGGWVYTRTGMRAGLPIAERWWPLDAIGRPCAWPVADVSDTARRGGD